MEERKTGVKEYECSYKKFKEMKFKELYQASIPRLDKTFARELLIVQILIQFFLLS